MPELLFIILLVICLGASAASLMMVYQMTRDYRSEFLDQYFYYLMAYFVFGLYGLWGQVIVRHLLHQMETKSAVIETMGGLLPLFGVPFLLVTWLMLIKMALSLVAKNVSSGHSVLYFLLVTVLLGTLGGILRNQFSLMQMELYFYMGFELCFYGMFLLFILTLSKRFENLKQRNIYRKFSLLILLSLGMRMILMPWISAHPLVVGGALLLYFVGAVPAVWFIRSKADTLYPLYHLGLKDQSHFNSFCNKHGISTREAQIVQLICRGQTNQDIADALFISLQTVKDHNHRIYTKIGIRSRVQLVNAVGKGMG